MRLVAADHPVLRRRADSATAPDATLEAGLRRAMRRSGGVGIAAPQLGRPTALCLLLVDGEETVCYNPRSLGTSGGVSVQEETCLSLPGWWLVHRAEAIEIEWTDADWSTRRARLSGWEARIAQHELDHLEGRTLVDCGEPLDAPAVRFKRAAARAGSRRRDRRR